MKLLALKNVEQVVPDAIPNTPLGIFQILPPELLYVIFDRIPGFLLYCFCSIKSFQ